MAALASARGGVSVARDEDEAADGFVFVRERLDANQFARKFDPAGPTHCLATPS